jgi:ubiquinone/menaquinone biosynthesis C-methylase UbiE/uncharacterized protein YbaR (Trm112 family)
MKELQSLLACPACHRELVWTADQVRCAGCGRHYPIEDGIPLLLMDQEAAGHDELEHLHGGHQHKREQAAYFDREEAAEFEIERPHGTPALYSWLLGDKFRRSIAGLGKLVPEATALAVCAGSGMDAEFLANAGARVISSDISLGAARRTRQRAQRYGLRLLPIVADVEHLPFGDRAVDLVYVHDGLHHLERPLAGLAEMARVAGRAVSVTEPAQAGATKLAIKLGLALEREEAGNRVARLTLDELEQALTAAVFKTVRAERYAMYYKHEPGSVFRSLSRGPVLPIVKGAYRAANAIAGGLGNKLTVQAVRESVPAKTSEARVASR